MTRFLLIRILLLVSFIVSLAVTLSALAEKLPQEELEVLKNFSGYSDMGHTSTVITPIRGAIETRLAQQKKQVERIVEELAGPRLRAEGYRLYVTLGSRVTPSVEINTYPEGAPDEKRWEENHPGAEWPIRKWLGFSKNGQPFYELHISLGALRLVQSRSELAFLVARELAGLLEKHDRHGGQHFGSKQKLEAVADQLAIDMMLGLYDLDASLRVLNAWFETENNAEAKIEAARKAETKKPQAQDDLDSQVALESFLDKEHHEGVRIAMLQYKIEFLKRTEERARQAELASRKFTPYTGGRTIIQRPYGRSKKGYFIEHLDEQKALIEKLFITQDPVEYVMGYYSDPKTDDQFSLENATGLIKPANDEIFVVLPWFLNRLQSEPGLTGQDRMDRFFAWWATYELNDSVAFATRLPPEIQRQFTIFLWRQISADKPWSLQTTASRFAERENAKKTSLTRIQPDTHIQWFFGYDNIGIASANVLAQTTRELWQPYAAQFVQLSQDKADHNPLRLISEYRAAYDDEPKSQRQRYPYWNELLRQAQLEYMQSNKYTEALNSLEEKLSSDYLLAIESLYRGREEGVEHSPAVTTKFDDYLSRFRLRRLEFVERLGRDSQRQEIPHHEYQSLMEEIFDSHKYAPFTPEELARIARPLFQVADSQINGYGTAIFLTPPNSPNALWVISHVLNGDELSRAEKKTLFKFAASEKYPSSDLDISPAKAETLQLMTRYVSTLTREDFLAVMAQPTPQFRRRIENIENDPGILKMEAAQKANDEKRIKLRESGASMDALMQTLHESLALMDFEATSKIMTAKSTSTSLVSSVLSLLTFAGSTPESQEVLANEFTFDDLKEMLRLVYGARSTAQRLQKRWSNFNSVDSVPSKLSPAAGSLLFQTLHRNGEAIDLLDWYFWFERIYRLGSANLEVVDGVRENLEAQIYKKLSALPAHQLLHYLKKAPVQDLLAAKNTSELILKYVSVMNPTDAKSVTGLFEKLQLRERYPTLYDEVRSKVAEHLKLQPGDIEGYFPKSKDNLTEQVGHNGFSADIRGLSALVALTRRQTVQDQIHMIDYLMERRADRPEFLTKQATDIEPVYPVTAIVQSLRDRLATANVVERTFIANSFLAGPSSAMNRPPDLKVILDHLLASVTPENRELADKLAGAMIESHGESASMALAYVFGQKGAAALARSQSRRF